MGDALMTLEEHWDRIGELWDAIDATQILESHVPSQSRWMLDRLLSRMKQMESVLSEALSEARYAEMCAEDAAETAWETACGEKIQ
jgi:hypothetical protein